MLFNQNSSLPLVGYRQAESILLVDVSSLSHRYWNTPGFRDMMMENTRTGHVFGFIKGITAYIKSARPRPTCLVFATDGYAKERYDIFPEYKGNRGDRSSRGNPVPDIVAITECIPGYTVHLPGWEADDAIASFLYGLRRMERSTHKTVHILSSDRDLFQLIDENTTVWTKPKESPIGMDNIGVDPKLIAIRKILHGDSSDNIKGVPFLRKKDVLPAVESCDGSLKDFLKKAKAECTRKTVSRLKAHFDVLKRNDSLVRLRIRKVKPIPNSHSKDRLRNIIINKFGCQSLQSDIERFF